ncbi:MAG: 30S ribosomal protein S21 [Patescibacteria group bacterium]
MITIEVKRLPNESNSSLMRRFSKRVQISGLIKKVKAGRFRVRAQSEYKKKQSALKMLARREHYARLKKLGKI